MQLHIGGQQRHADWKIVDIEPREEVDFIQNALDLQAFEDNSVSKIYASHILEHFHYGLGEEVHFALKEWYRVLMPGGQLLVSVPDLKTLCNIYLLDDLIPQERMKVMYMIYGGQKNKHDRHFVGFDFETLGLFLMEAGFKNYRQVDEFGIFDDTSRRKIRGQLISLNVIATK